MTAFEKPEWPPDGTGKASSVGRQAEVSESASSSETGVSEALLASETNREAVVFPCSESSCVSTHHFTSRCSWKSGPILRVSEFSGFGLMVSMAEMHRLFTSCPRTSQADPRPGDCRVIRNAPSCLLRSPGLTRQTPFLPSLSRQRTKGGPPWEPLRPLRGKSDSFRPPSGGLERAPRLPENWPLTSHYAFSLISACPGHSHP